MFVNAYAIVFTPVLEGYSGLALTPRNGTHMREDLDQDV